MSTGLITALEFLMAAEVSKTILLPSLDAVLLLVATFGSRALMSLLLRAEMRSERAERAEAKRDEHRAGPPCRAGDPAAFTGPGKAPRKAAARTAATRKAADFWHSAKRQPPAFWHSW